ncbi:cyclic nucleotide-binding protein [Candidatus Vecturithrix granuli]|uniref:Cyclic nucleotide-binding protein n=1 Tax=Vecturithrix granuli TaxID=1499967 RepID=A0A081BZS0_VECG1|nr:cyclic nucleotide-binding protein [Candidatus Vecturithrix granuli]
MPIFGGIRADILEYLLEIAEIVSVPAGQYFFREQDRGNSMYVLEKGEVSVVKSWQGQDYPLTRFHEGDCFGEMSLIDLGPRTASVLAIEDCSAIKLSNGNILKIYQKDLEQFTLIQMNIGREISRRLRHMDEAMFQERVDAHRIPYYPEIIA